MLFGFKLNFSLVPTVAQLVEARKNQIEDLLDRREYHLMKATKLGDKVAMMQLELAKLQGQETVQICGSIQRAH